MPDGLSSQAIGALLTVGTMVIGGTVVEKMKTLSKRDKATTIGALGGALTSVLTIVPKLEGRTNAQIASVITGVIIGSFLGMELGG